MTEEVQILELARALVRDKAVEFDKVLLALSAVGPFGGLETFEEYLVSGRYCSPEELKAIGDRNTRCNAAYLYEAGYDPQKM